jgi:ornithine cyclodeaminase/alanine dehydrogenase-like protein (mu-crystallin family)
MTDGTRILTRSDVAALLPLDECIEAVEAAFKADAMGQSLGPGVLSVHAHDGAFHIKAAGLPLGRNYFAAKTNGNFFHNAERYGLPRIQGTVVLCDADNGYPLAVLDSIEITIRRTGAATGVAARHLARRNASVATIIGCGNQGRVSLDALRAVLPIERALVYDADHERACAFARDAGAEAVKDLVTALAESDICVTCTPSRSAILRREHAHPGLFIAAVGADSSEKQEIEPGLLAASRVFVDHLEQCATLGDLHHALAAGVMTRDDVAGTLGDVVTGRSGRGSDDELIIFDSTGTALQDVAAAAIVYERSVAAGRGIVVRFDS